MTNLVKICGIKTQKFIDICVNAKADFIGFNNFAKSPRYVSMNAMDALITHAPKSVKTVILTVNPSLADIEKIARLNPDYIQLHGQETTELCDYIKSKTKMNVIKEVPIANEDDVLNARSFEKHVDILLFDAKPIAGAILPGGNGQAFNWQLLEDQNFECQTMLAGGLNSTNVELAMAQSHINVVDISSAVEIERGVKDQNLIEEFIRKVKG